MWCFVQFKSRLNQLSLSHESNKEDEKSKTKNDEQLSHELVIKMHEIEETESQCCQVTK